MGALVGKSDTDQIAAETSHMVGANKYAKFADESEECSTVSTPSAQPRASGKHSPERRELFQETFSSEEGDVVRSGVADRTLALTLPDVHERHQAYLERKKNRKRGKSKALGKNEYLSNVPEVEADIEYRYVFQVLGVMAEQVVEAVCSSSSATRLSMLTNAAPQLATTTTMTEETLPPLSVHAEEGGTSDSECSDVGDMRSPCVRATSCDSDGSMERLGYLSARSCRSRSQARIHRCLCNVELPLSLTGRQKLAKLAFKAVPLDRRVPTCNSRTEALATAVVFVLVVDAQGEDDSFEDQLLHYEKAVYDMRGHPRRLRPARTLLLLQSQDGDGASVDGTGGRGNWKVLLEQFEEVDGPFWKLGPIRLSDSDELHSCFSAVASSRIVRSQKSEGADSDGSHTSEPPPVWEAECEKATDDEDSEDDVPAPLQKGQAPQLRQSWLSALERGAA